MLPEEIWEKPLTDSNGFYSRWDPVLSSEIYGSLLQPLNTRGPLAKMPETFPERPTTAGSPQSPLEDVLYSEESSDISHGPITAVEAVQDSTIDSNSSESPASHCESRMFNVFLTADLRTRDNVSIPYQEVYTGKSSYRSSFLSL